MTEITTNADVTVRCVENQTTVGWPGPIIRNNGQEMHSTVTTGGGLYVFDPEAPHRAYIIDTEAMVNAILRGKHVIDAEAT